MAERKKTGNRIDQAARICGIAISALMRVPSASNTMQ